MNRLGIVFFLLSSNLAFSQCNLKIEVSGIKRVKGQIVVGIFNRASSFLKSGEEYRTLTVDVKQSSSEIILPNLPKGRYAVSVYQDENSDKTCNLNFLRIPKEGYGFSRNYVPFRSAPKFNDCAFDLQKDTSIQIKLLF